MYFLWILLAAIGIILLFKLGKSILMKTYYSDDPLDYFDENVKKESNKCHKHPKNEKISPDNYSMMGSPCTFCGCQCGSCDCRHG